ncbi:hypothetical protein EDC01DRAFT_92591, partial [Geopyxis carbonaria]
LPNPKPSTLQSICTFAIRIQTAPINLIPVAIPVTIPPPHPLKVRAIGTSPPAILHPSRRQHTNASLRAHQWRTSGVSTHSPRILAICRAGPVLLASPRAYVWQALVAARPASRAGNVRQPPSPSTANHGAKTDGPDLLRTVQWWCSWAGGERAPASLPPQRRAGLTRVCFAGKRWDWAVRLADAGADGSGPTLEVHVGLQIRSAGCECMGVKNYGELLPRAATPPRPPRPPRIPHEGFDVGRGFYFAAIRYWRVGMCELRVMEDGGESADM